MIRTCLIELYIRLKNKNSTKDTYLNTVQSIKNTPIRIRMYARRGEILEELTTPHLRYNTPKPERITHRLPFVAASSLEDRHAPAWGPFFFVVHNMLQDASLWDPYIHIPSNDLPTLQAVKFVLKGRGRTIVKTAWELKIPRSLGGDGGHG